MILFLGWLHATLRAPTELQPAPAHKDLCLQVLPQMRSNFLHRYNTMRTARASESAATSSPRLSPASCASTVMAWSRLWPSDRIQGSCGASMYLMLLFCLKSVQFKKCQRASSQSFDQMSLSCFWPSSDPDNETSDQPTPKTNTSLAVSYETCRISQIMAPLKSRMISVALYVQTHPWRPSLLLRLFYRLPGLIWVVQPLALQR